MTPDFFNAGGRIAWYRGDGSERCLVCGLRDPGRSYYVGQIRMLTDEGLAERFPVCDEEHGLMAMESILKAALHVPHAEQEYAF